MLRTLLHRAPSVAIFVLASWTLLAQTLVALGLSLVLLEIASLIAIVGAVAVGVRRRRCRAAAAELPVELSADTPATRSELLRFVVALVCATSVVLAFVATGEIVVLSTGGAAILLLGLLWRARGSGDLPAPTVPRSSLAGVGLLTLALVTAVLTLIAHNPDPDDAFYLNVAAQVAAAPTAPMLVEDGIFGIEDMPIQLPVYRAHSIELLVGAVAHLSSLEPIEVAHLGLVALAGFLLPLAAARLLHRLVPGYAVLGALVTVVVLVACGEGELGPGHFGLLRLQQGKGLLCALAMPMLFDGVLAYAQAPSRGSWLRLFAAQVAAVGMTSSALLLVPLTAAITLVVTWRHGHASIGKLLLGLSASAHAMLILAWLGPAMVEQVELMAALASVPFSSLDSASIALDTLQRALGESAWTALLLVLVLSAWAVPRRDIAGRALAGSSLVLFGLFLRPEVATWVAERLLAPDVYFRILWTVPWGVAASITLIAPLRMSWRSTRRRRVFAAVTIALAVGLPLWTTPTTVLDEAAQTRVAWPQRKVPPLEYEAARWLAENTPPGARVLAPLDVAPWVSTFRSLPHPVYSRFIYERYLLLGLPDEEVYQRRTLAGFVSYVGNHLDRTEVLCHHADARDLRGIALRRFGARTDRQIEQLASCGFERAGQNERYEVWVRTAAVSVQP